MVHVLLSVWRSIFSEVKCLQDKFKVGKGASERLDENYRPASKNLFTGSLTINFYKGNLGKIQLARTVKGSDVEYI